MTLKVRPLHDRLIVERIDATTPAGRLRMHILGAIAEFERARIAERVRAGLSRARRQGKKLGRPRARLHGETLNERRACRAGVRQRYLTSRRPRCGGFGWKRRDSPIARMSRL